MASKKQSVHSVDQMDQVLGMATGLATPTDAQKTKIKETLGVTELEQEVGNFADVNSLRTDGGYATQTVGSAATFTSSTTYFGVSIDKPIYVGDKFTIYGKGGAGFRLWATLNSNGIIVRNSAASLNALTTPAEVTIEDGEVALVCNTSADSTSSFKVIRGDIQKSLDDVEKSILATIAALPKHTGQTIVVAAYDSTDEMKKYADYTAGSESTGIANINAAITSLHSNGGGTIFLANGTYGGAYAISLYGDVILVGESTNVVIRSTTSKAVLESKESGCYVSNVNVLRARVTNDNDLYLSNVVLNGEPYNGYVLQEVIVASSDSSEEHQALADYVLSDNIAATINTIIKGNARVILMAGTYATTAMIDVSVSNRSLIGRGGTVTINRNSAGHCVATTAAIENTYVEGLTCNTSIKIARSGAHNGHIVNCYQNETEYISDVYVGKVGINEIHCGEGQQVADLDVAIQLSTYEYPSSDSTYRIWVHGYQKLTHTALRILQATYEIFGADKDAEIDVYSTSNFSGYQFRDMTDGTYNRSVIKDVTFTKSGEYTGYQTAPVEVRGNHLKFYNCTFKNDTSSPVAFNQATDTSGTGLNTNGDRRHGILVECGAYDTDCETEFHNCKAIGSPYGFKNTRGWYILKGSPRLYDCIGIGGGIGERGYGIVCHMASKAFIYNSQFYGSPYGYRLNNGIQFQAASESRMYHCTGFAGSGYKYISTGGRDNYVKQDERCEASHGMGVIMDASPTLVDCVGYAGWSEGSYSLYIDETAHPTIVGGIYSQDKGVYHSLFTKDEDQAYMTIPLMADQLLKIEGIYMRDGSGLSGKYFLVKSGDTIMANEVFSSTEQPLTLLATSISANAGLEIHITNADGTDYSAADGCVNIIIRYTSGNSHTGKYEGENTNAVIQNAYIA